MNIDESKIASEKGVWELFNELAAKDSKQC